MKRLIFGILVLLGVWQLLQIPSINAAFFAFLTLGINPFTNQQLSTLSLVLLLLAAVFGIVALFFSRAFSDFFGGVADWLTRAEYEYQAAPEGLTESPMMPTVNLSSSDLELSSVIAMQPISTPDFAGPVRKLHLPTIALGSSKFSTLMRNTYRQSITALQTRMSALKRAAQTPIKRHADTNELTPAGSALSPELAEVLAIFERLAIDTEASEPAEAVVVEKTERKMPIPASVVARKAGNFFQNGGHVVVRLVSRTRRALYKGLLLSMLGIILTVGKIAAFTKQILVRMRNACVAGAVGITLGLFVSGRALVAVAHAVNYGLARVFQGIYWLCSTLIMLSLIAAGYVLFVFSFACLMIWELFEPYAQKIDHWLGRRFDANGELSEVTKVGHEMTRTFMQWYRELRNIKHSIYH